jgi:hypothetical protein
LENQHRHIKGYRDLSEAEIAAMNAIKDHAEQTRALIEQAREAGADLRWLAIATTELQQGFMALTRAVAKPTSF